MGISMMAERVEIINFFMLSPFVFFLSSVQTYEIILIFMLFLDKNSVNQSIN